MTFKTLDSRVVTLPLEPKAIQDETSEVWDYEYGRMSGKLGLSMPFVQRHATPTSSSTATSIR